MKLEHYANVNKQTDLPLELFYSALNAAVDAVLIADKHGKILWVNKSFEQLTGYSHQEALGKDTSLLKSGRQSDQFYNNMWNTLTSGNVWQGELWNKKKNNSLYLEDQTITPVVNNNNMLTHFVAIKRDVSEKIAIKRQLEHAEKMEIIGQIVGGISHNFNNKLANILGYNELATELVVTFADKTPRLKLDKYLAKIASAGLEAKKLVAQLQTFCREEKEQFKPISLVEVISELVPLVAKSIAKNINITFNAAPHVALIEAEPTQLHQMLMILIHNSIKALPNGGEIVVELNQCDFKQGVEQEGTTQICCSCHRNIIGNFVELAIGDNGQGITQKNIQKLFLPFFTTHQMDGGTGMGLSVLHGMLHEHHGHVLISSEPEQGAKFSLLFPVYEQINAIDDVIHNEVVNRDNLDKAHILLVDDEQIVVDLLAELLTFSGYQISAHTNVQSALAMFMAAPETFDLLITDQNMAGLTGLMLARAIKQVRIDLPAILISGKPVDNFADDINFIESIDGFLTKPFKTKQLNTLVEKLIKDNSSAK